MPIISCIVLLSFDGFVNVDSVLVLAGYCFCWFGLHKRPKAMYGNDGTSDQRRLVRWANNQSIGEGEGGLHRAVLDDEGSHR
jgi:hypothetical protein